MSRLIEQLEKLGKGTPAPIGFGPRALQEKTPTMLLLGTLPGEPSFKLERFSEAKLDALLLTVENPRTIPKGLTQREGLIWGIETPVLTPETVAWLKEKGCDFLVFPAETTPVEALDDDIGKILRVRPDLEENLARTLEDLPINGVLLAPAASEPPLTLHNLMVIGALRGLVDKPFLLSWAAPLSRRELEGLRDVGVDGIVIDLEKVKPSAVGDLRRQVHELPRRRPAPERPPALLPHAGPGQALSSIPEEEEE